MAKEIERKREGVETEKERNGRRTKRQGNGAGGRGRALKEAERAVVLGEKVQ